MIEYENSNMNNNNRYKYKKSNKYNQYGVECEFIHFPTKYDCELFIEYINNTDITLEYGHTCCNGLGICILNVTHDYVELLKYDFYNSIIIIDYCNVCNIPKRLMHKCKTYNHPMCQDCISKTIYCTVCINKR